jgi:LmbE family N-acetylglucosaminyl deacetylase
MTQENRKSVLVIAAHPDDETLGCGGTMLKHRSAGDQVAWMIATQAHEPRWSAAIQERKASEITAAANAYDIADVFRLGLPAIRLDAVPHDDIVTAMRPGFEEMQPDTVYLVHPGDVHTDHRAVFEAAWTLMRNFRATTTGPRRVLLYETISSTDGAPPIPGRGFTPNAFSDITPWIDQKLAVAALFESEMQLEPLPRSPSAIRALARSRGAAIGVPYAEAFALMRDIF